ncbi:hypothetical protein INT45_000981 [Circinella minor]|uniref:Uncharacterized protein n=1 Tax=Circinella minor TaxID=1195481 RepID=A0A8H7RWG1_9FUNG|nr:hypothetical protein INT45_000981 [Circinella minor]
MSRNPFHYKQWVNQQSTRATQPAVLAYDYFDFARQLDSSEAITNVTFDRALSYAGKKADKYHQIYTSKARKKMSKYVAEKMTDITASTMESIAEDMVDLARKRHHSLAGSISLPSSATDPPVIPSTTTHTPTDLRTAIIPWMKVVDQFDTSLKNLNRVDFTETGVYDLFKKIERDWVPDAYCAALLKNMAEADPDQEDFVVSSKLNPGPISTNNNNSNSKKKNNKTVIVTIFVSV